MLNWDAAQAHRKGDASVKPNATSRENAKRYVALHTFARENGKWSGYANTQNGNSLTAAHKLQFRECACAGRLCNACHMFRNAIRN